MAKDYSKIISQESIQLVPSAIGVKDWHRNSTGIRGQLVHLPIGILEQDFIVTNQANATHILNAVSLGWTSSIPFGKHVAEVSVLPLLG